MPIQLPERFKERYATLVDDPEAFFACLLTMPPKSFRVNTLKTSAKEVKNRFDGYGIELRSAPWYEDAFTSQTLDIGSSLEHFLGHIYFQELASMLPPLLVRQELGSANLVLDACAAPGSKTTQLAAFMENKGTIIANDIDYSRIRALKFNLEKTGTLNTVITNMDLRHFPNMQFDVILLDAPCSAEGTIRKNEAALSGWSEKQVLNHSNVQKHLILKAFDLLAPEGVLVYSTCTFAPEENEGVIHSLLTNRSDARLEKVNLPEIKLAPAVGEWNGEAFDSEISKTARVWPHHNDSEGFFLAKVRK